MCRCVSWLAILKVNLHEPINHVINHFFFKDMAVRCTYLEATSKVYEYSVITKEDDTNSVFNNYRKPGVKAQRGTYKISRLAVREFILTVEAGKVPPEVVKQFPDDMEAWTRSLLADLHLAENQWTSESATTSDAYSLIVLDNFWLLSLHQPREDKDKKKHQVKRPSTNRCYLTIRKISAANSIGVVLATRDISSKRIFV